MKRLLLAMMCLIVAACAADKDAVRKKAEEKKETPLWQIIAYTRGSGDKIEYRDKWFKYNVDIEHILPGGEAPQFGFMTSCPVDSATFTVYDRESGAVVRTEHLAQSPCTPCHKR